MIVHYVGGDGVCTSCPHGEAGKRLLWEGFLVVDGEVTDFKDLILVTGTTEHQSDELHEDEGHQCGPEDHKQSRSELFPQLVRGSRVHEPIHPERRTGSVSREIRGLRRVHHLPGGVEMAAAVL